MSVCLSDHPLFFGMDIGKRQRGLGGGSQGEEVRDGWKDGDDRRVDPDTERHK